MYDRELVALKKANRYRARKIYDSTIVDMASNDYLGLSHSHKSLKKAYKMLSKYQTISPKASMLVNGYHPLHQKFERLLCKLNGFEDGIVVGSGFLANMALIESLVRKNDLLFIDEEYHASGIMASKLLGDRVVVFRHNDTMHLKELLQTHSYKRAIIAIEGIYSMSGDMCKREFFDIADSFNAVLIVDEAHSAGVVGKSLLGVYEHFGITIKPNHIKMGTLGKAYGSYGAYILSSSKIISFLQNRAKPIVYSTAPSVFDVALAYVNVKKIVKNSHKLIRKKQKIQKIVKKYLNKDINGLIVSIDIGDNQKVMQIQQKLLSYGILVGAIRQPTVPSAIIRVIPNLSIKPSELRFVLKYMVK
jgi:8-amino-7-oxononanoate synthase